MRTESFLLVVVAAVILGLSIYSVAKPPAPSYPAVYVCVIHDGNAKVVCRRG